MKKPAQKLAVAVRTAMILTMSIVACSGGGGGGSTVNPSAYPTAADNYEGSGGDNALGTASAINVGQTQVRTLFPMGDVDWVGVRLTAGTEYEFSANNLAAATDGFMYLFSTDGATELDTGDDYISLDPDIRFTPGATGTYYIKVMTYGDAPDGGNFKEKSLLAYTLGVREFTDGDNDGYSPYYDCNDGDATIYPKAVEIPGDGIDQNCSGVDEIAGTTPDPSENDDDITSAKVMVGPIGDPNEIQYRHATFMSNARTIDSPGEKDWFSIRVPAYGRIKFLLAYQGSACIEATTYEPDGTTVIDTSLGAVITNNSSTAFTYFMVYQGCGGTDTGYYVPSYINLGVDMDGDGYYTKDWDVFRDCDDTDPGTHPGATEILSDGIDQDCDGSDST